MRRVVCINIASLCRELLNRLDCDSIQLDDITECVEVQLADAKHIYYITLYRTLDEMELDVKVIDNTGICINHECRAVTDKTLHFNLLVLTRV